MNMETHSYFEREGFFITQALLSQSDCETLGRKAWPETRAGGNRNLLQEPWCQELARQLKKLPPLNQLIPADFVAIQCTYFEKSTATNWLVPIHQDLSIPVKQRIDSGELTGWSVKNGEYYVQAPITFTAQLIAVRVHLDDCGPEDGPVTVIPGTHLDGKINTNEATRIRQNQTNHTCVLKAGAALVMRPLLLHMSSKASGASKRRVLHFVFAPAMPPLALEYACSVS